MDKRPILNTRISIKDFKEFYWLKSELMIFCREIGINSNGGKIEITDRISKYLETGKIIKKVTTIKPKLYKASKPITKETIIGIEYRTYKEKKEFLQSVIGKCFHFTTNLLDYFKKNSGKKTYNDLIDEYYKDQKRKKDPSFQSEIAPQFEYNTYIRDFIKDNPNKKRIEAIKYWKIKKSLRGNNIYKKTDLNNEEN